MKKVLLAGVAVLSVLSASAAHSHDTVILPDTITGTWCYSEGDNPDPQLRGPTVYTGHARERCLHSVDEIGIRQDGLDEHEDWCAFNKIEQTGVNTFLIYLQCKDGNDDVIGGGPTTFEIIDGKLVITPLSEG